MLRGGRKGMRVYPESRANIHECFTDKDLLITKCSSRACPCLKPAVAKTSFAAT